MDKIKYQPAIGIETHVQLKTATKLFCGCSNVSADAKPNTLICPVCVGLPGVLPVLNANAVKLAIRLGIALNGKVATETKFDRKNYFYPDLPKGYQISQYDMPIISGGYVEVPTPDGPIKINLIRAHLEEDAGKLLHPTGANYSLLDLNRAGTPLMEIVSAPDIKSAAEAKAYVHEVYHIVRYGGISDADLFLGNMRFDVNISLAKPNAKELGTRSEIKNLNSFRAVEKAIEYEIKRQSQVLDKRGKVRQETLGWDDAKGKTISQRGKEEAHDYRYFPEPDLPPITISQKQITTEAKAMPKLPKDLRASLIKQGLDIQTAAIIIDAPQHAELFTSAASGYPPEVTTGVAKYITGKVRAYQKAHPKQKLNISFEALANLYELQATGKIHSSAADNILEEMLRTGRGPLELAKDGNLLQVSDEGELTKLAEQIVTDNPKAVADFLGGKERSMQFLVGQLMAKSKGRANPKIAAKLIETAIKNK